LTFVSEELSCFRLSLVS